MRNYVLLSKLFQTVFTQFNCSLASGASFQRPLILGIETSCDDTGAALIDQNGKIFGEYLQSQQSTHLRNGGIIPPIAQELHRRNIEMVVKNTFKNVDFGIEDIDAVAVTNRPGTVTLEFYPDPISLIINYKSFRVVFELVNRSTICKIFSKTLHETIDSYSSHGSSRVNSTFTKGSFISIFVSLMQWRTLYFIIC